MKLDDFKLISNELASLEFDGKPVCENIINDMSGEFAIGKLSDEVNSKFAMRTRIELSQKGKDTEEEFSNLKIEYMSLFNVDVDNIDELLKSDALRDIMPDIINKFIYPNISEFLKIMYKEAKIKINIPERLLFGEE